MKNILFIVFAIITLESFGQNANMQVMPVKNQDIFKVFYKSDIKWDVELAVINQKGKKVIEYDLDDKDGFIFPIDFSKLESGTYNVRLTSSAFELEKEVEFLSRFDMFSSKLEAEVINETKRVLLTLTEPMEGTISLSIHGENEVIEQQTIDAKEFGMRAFDFSDSDSYPVNVTVRYEGKFLNTWTVGD